MGWLTPQKLKMVPAPKKAIRNIEVSSLPNTAPVRIRTHDGEKFAGGWGVTDLWQTDYWTLRKRSAELFKRNIYARGLIRTLITNELNTGLHLEATPEERLLGFGEDALADWCEDVENRFQIWAKDPYLCDQKQKSSFGALQATARREALVVGDVLVVMRQDPKTRAPKIQLINGERVRSPSQNPPAGTKIIHGVELDSFGRHVAYWVTQDDGTSKRLPAIGEKSGRRLAWLVYGTDLRMDDVRGEPLLSIVLQSLKEIDSYRDSVQRKALVNSYLAMYIAKTEDKPGTRPITGGAIRKGTALATDTTGTERRFNIAEQVPGYVVEELQHGETPHGFPATGTDEKFADFEQAILMPFAWGMEIPPEVLLKSFRNNYSASQAANNEFKAYLNKARTVYAEAFCEPIYQEWLVAEVLAQRISAAGLLDAWRDPLRFTELGAWVSSDWAGNVKPAIDMKKLADALEKIVSMGGMTRDRMARELTGTKFSKNVQKLARENEQLAKANAPIAALEASTKPAPEAPAEPDEVDDEDEEDEDEATAKVLPLREARS